MDQSIYRFRHANPEGITNFVQTHPTTHDESLIECRRCPHSVVRIADYLIRHNHDAGEPPRLNPMPGNPQGHVHIVQWITVADEAQGLADHIAWLLQQGHSPGEILVLTSRRLLGYAIRDRLQELNVPVHSFYHEEALESDAAQTALTLLANNEDRVALRWWLGYGSPSARKEAYKKIREHCEATGISPWAALSAMEQGTLAVPRTSSLLDRFRELKAILASVAGGDLAAIVHAVIPENSEGCDALREAAVLALDQVENIEDLVDALKAVVSQPELPDEGDYVRVMSLHKSKGLTSKVAIVSGCVQGLVPFQDDDQSENEQEAILKEQRRLFYVAMTRCTERLIISSFTRIQRKVAYKIGARLAWGKSRIGRTIASGFLAELGPHAPAAQAGADWQAAGFA